MILFSVEAAEEAQAKNNVIPFTVFFSLVPQQDPRSLHIYFLQLPVKKEKKKRMKEMVYFS